MAIPPMSPPPAGPPAGQPVPNTPWQINGGQTMNPGGPATFQKQVAEPLKPYTGAPVTEENPPDEIQDVSDIVAIDPDSLVGMITKEFNDYKSARMPIETGIFLRAFLNFKGVYIGNADLNGGTSTAFVQVTSPKARTALAMLMQIIMPPGDQGWSFDAPTEPMMVDQAFELLKQGMPLADVKINLRTLAEAACEALTVKAAGGLEEANYDIKVQQVGLDSIVFGTGFLEGPLAIENLPVDAPDEDGDLNLWRRIVKRAREAVGLPVTEQDKLNALVKAGVLDAVKPDIQVWSPFDVYLDPGAKIIEQCRSVILRLVVNRMTLREWRGQKGFDADAINSVLNDAADGNWKPESWESVVSAGNSQFQQNMPNGRFVVLKRWGMFSGQDLKEAGLDVPDDQLEEQVMAQAWVCGTKLIRLSVSDELHKDRIPIYAVPYMVSPQSIYGVGLPEMMFDSQDAINACERAKMDNMGFICRPQVSIRTALLDLQDSTEAIEMVPGKMWRIKESPLPPNGMKPVEFWVPPNALAEISRTQSESMQLADEQTAIPAFLMGQGSEGVHNRTLGGATLQFDRAITPFKSVIFNFDKYLTVPLMTKLGRFYQLFSNDPAIKGDFKVTAKGVQGLMAREIMSQKISEALQAIGNNPQLSEEASTIFNPVKVLDKFLQGTGLAGEDLSYTPTEIAQHKQAQAQQQAKDQQQQMNLAMAPKMRAETPQKDALLDIMKAAPDGSQLQLTLVAEAAHVWGFGTQQVDQAAAHDMEKAKITDTAAAHAAGHDIAARETTMPALPPMPPPAPTPQG